MEQKGIFVVHHYGSFHYGNWQEATQKWKMEKKGLDLPMTSATTV